MIIFGIRIITESSYQSQIAGLEDEKKKAKLTAAELKNLIKENMYLRNQIHRRGIKC